MLQLLILALGCTGVVASTTAVSQAPAGFWDTWGDGRAELVGYRLAQPRYGELRQGEVVLITVTETFTKGQRVKSDGGHPDEFPVIKLNDARDFQTGLYDYNAMTSAFVPLDGSLPLGLPSKVSTSVQEWCGHAWDEVVVDPGRLSRSTHSYFDGENTGDSTVAMPDGVVFADTLPILVRGLAGELVAAGASREITLAPRLMDLRLKHRPLQFEVVTLSRSAEPSSVVTPAGTFQVDRFRLEGPGSWSMEFQVEVAPPHRLVGWSHGDGEVAVMTGSMRSAYWQQQGEGDEGLRGELGLARPHWMGLE